MIGVSVSRDRFTSNLGKKVAQAQRQRLEDAMGRGHSFSSEVVPEDRGQLRQSMFVPEWRGDSLEYGATARQAAPMEFGTEPGHRPPTAPLVEWAERVADDPGLGHYLAKVKIPRDGVDAQPYLRPGLNVAERHIQNNSLGDYLDL